MNSLEELKPVYEDFLRSDDFNYVDKITTAIDDYTASIQNNNANNISKSSSSKNNGSSGPTGCPRVKIKLSELRSENPVLERRLVNDPLRHLRALEFAAHDVAKDERPGYDDKYGEFVDYSLLNFVQKLCPF